MIKINNLHKYFGNQTYKIHALKDISIDFDENGLVCILGESGCGKSTFLNIIGGLDNASSGSVCFDSFENKFKEKNLLKIRNEYVGFIFQNYNLIEDKTVYDNLSLVLNATNLTKEEKDNRINYVLDLVKMSKYLNRKTKYLSGGEAQRIAIARAIIKKPKVILADEPTGSLDDINTKNIIEILKTISKDYLVILVTHEEEIAYKYANRIIKLDEGVVISDNFNEGSFLSINKNISLDSVTYNKKYRLNIKEYLHSSVEKLLNFKGGVKILFITFMISMVMFIFASSALYSSIVVNDKYFISSGYNDYTISSMDETNLVNLVSENNLGILYSRISFEISSLPYSQISSIYHQGVSLKGGLKRDLNFSDIIYGEYSDEQGVLIDTIIIDDLIKDSYFYNAGLSTYEDFIGLTFNQNLTISGIVDTNTPLIYFSVEAFLESTNHVSGNLLYYDVGIFNDSDYKTTVTTLEDDEIIVSENTCLNIGDEFIISNKVFNVVGYITDSNSDYIISEDAYLQLYYYNFYNRSEISEYNLYSFDNDITEDTLNTNTAVYDFYYNIYDRDKLSFISNNVLLTTILMISAIVLCVISLTFLYFIIKANLLSRTKEVGIYRSLGMTKRSIYLIFTSEIFLISLISSVCGYLIAILLINIFGSFIGLSFSFLASIITYIVIFSINIIISIIPTKKLVKNSPINILTIN